MDDFLATFWLIGQILSAVAFCVGLVLSVLYWGLRDAVPQFTPEPEKFIDNSAVVRAPASPMPIGVLKVVGRDEGDDPKPPFMHFPPGQGPRPAAPA